MIRYLIIVFALLFASQVKSQERIFRASPIDIEQNKRLDTLELRVASLESTTKETIQEPLKPEPKPITSAITDPLTGTVVTGPAVVMITNGQCVWCDRWWASHSQQLEDKNWQVKKVVGNFPGVTVFPTFRVYDRQTWSQHSGYMSMDDLRSLLGRSTSSGKAQSQDFVGRYSTVELRSMIAAKRPGGWRGPVYADVAPRSAAKQHLVGREHGFSWDQVSGLTQNEALILHDLAPRHGNQIFPYRSGQQPARQPARQAMANLGCANGGCAKQTRVLTSRWLRR